MERTTLLFRDSRGPPLARLRLPLRRRGDPPRGGQEGPRCAASPGAQLLHDGRGVRAFGGAVGPLPDPGRARPRRHGNRVPSARHLARPHGRLQGVARHPEGKPAGAEELPARGEGRCQAQSPERRDGVRYRRAGRPLLPSTRAAEPRYCPHGHETTYVSTGLAPGCTPRAPRPRKATGRI